MRILLLISGLIFIFTVQAQSPKKLLYKAYNKQSSELLDNFFGNWKMEIPPIRDSEFQGLNDTLRNIYTAYSEFLKWKTNDSACCRYELIQNSISVSFTKKVYFTEDYIDSIIALTILADDSLDQTSKKRYLTKKNGSFSFSQVVKELYGPDYKTLTKPVFSMAERNFRPLSGNPNRILYLNARYEKLLYKFLHRGKGTDRKDFLDRYLKIQKDPFTRKWEFVPYSFASVTFDEKMEYIRIDYSIGERIYMKLENGKWQFVSRELVFYR